jgi:hypothetical protein
MAAAWLTLATEILVMSLSMWIVCGRIGIVPGGDQLGRIALASAATWLVAFGLNQAGVPTLVWVAAGGAVYAALVVALGAVRLEELRTLTRRGGA